MRAMLWMGSVIVALAVLIGAGRLWAENKEQKPAKVEAPRTRIALVNLTYVIQNYEKYTKFQAELKKALEPFQHTELRLRQKADALRKTFEDVANLEKPISREEYESQAKALQRKKEDNDEKAKKMIGKKSDEAIKALYLDVLAAAQRYAIAHDFDLVLQYNDATNEEDYLGVENIAGKVNTRGLMPMYTAPGMDISMDVVKLLNHNKGNN